MYLQKAQSHLKLIHYLLVLKRGQAARQQIHCKKKPGEIRNEPSFLLWESAKRNMARSGLTFHHILANFKIT